MAALWNSAVNPVSITWWVQWLVSGRHFKKIIVGNGHIRASDDGPVYGTRNVKIGKSNRMCLIAGQESFVVASNVPIRISG
jgi:hypothetical protein